MLYMHLLLERENPAYSLEHAEGNQNWAREKILELQRDSNPWPLRCVSAAVLYQRSTNDMYEDLHFGSATIFHFVKFKGLATENIVAERYCGDIVAEANVF